MKRFLFAVATASLLAAAVSFAAGTAKPAAPHPGTSHASMAHGMSQGQQGIWKGELLDAGCYLGHGAMGEKHKECALKCASQGMPLMLLQGDKAVLLTMDHDNADPYNSLKVMAGSVVEITGTMSTRGGVTGINVTGAKLAAAK